MESIKDFLAATRTLPIIKDRFYFIGPISYRESEMKNDFSEDRIKEIKKRFKSEVFLIMDTNRPDFNLQYSNAKSTLPLLNDEQLNKYKKLTNVEIEEYRNFLTVLANFFVLFGKGEAHPRDIDIFLYSLKSYFYSDTPENAKFSQYFLSELMDDVTMRKGRLELFLSHIDNLLTPDEAQSNQEPTTDLKTPSKNIEFDFSVPQWAAAFYYAITDTNKIPGKYRKDKQLFFMKKHNIEKSENTFYNLYSDVEKQINETYNFPIDKLEEVVPFLEKYYIEAVDQIKDDISFLKIERDERERKH